MLPPDTSSSLLPWRVMVPMMQVYGCFPYRMYATSPRPVFILPLFLWGVVVQLLILILFCVAFENDYIPFLSSDMGTVTYIYCSITMIATLCLSPLILATRGDMLASLMQDLSLIRDVSPPPACRWYCKKDTLVFLFFLALLMSYSMWFFCAYIDRTSFLELTFFAFLGMLCPMDFWMPGELFSMVCGLLAHRVLVVTEATVVTVSALLAPDGSLKGESALEAAMAALRGLEAVIREVGRKGAVLGVVSDAAIHTLRTLYMYLHYVYARLCKEKQDKCGASCILR